MNLHKAEGKWENVDECKASTPGIDYDKIKLISATVWEEAGIIDKDKFPELSARPTNLISIEADCGKICCETLFTNPNKDN